MKMIDIDCDWETEMARVRVWRLNGRGAYSYRQYRVERYSATSERLLELVRPLKSKFLGGNEFRYYYY